MCKLKQKILNKQKDLARVCYWKNGYPLTYENCVDIKFEVASEVKEDSASNFIIEIENGIVVGVYTDLGQKILVRIKDNDDKYDDLRCNDYSELQKTIDSGTVKDVLYG